MQWNRFFTRDIVIAGALLLCIIVVGAVRAARRPAPEQEVPGALSPTNLDGEVHNVVEVMNRPERKADRQVALDAIASHEAKIAEDPSHVEVPAYRLAIANLYITRLGDLEFASVHLDALISQFPESNLAAQAYAKLANCYENMGDWSLADYTYRKMMNHFPEGSANWEYARAKRFGDTAY